MLSTTPTAPPEIRTFERLRERALRSRQYAEHKAWGCVVPEELATRSPEDATLTHAEIEAANEILKAIIERYNRENDSSIEFMSSKNYEEKYGHDKDEIWERIAEYGRIITMWCDYAITHVVGLSEIRPDHNFFNYGEVTMRDKFVTQSALAVGPGAQATARDVQQTSIQGSTSYDLDVLAKELATLRAAMKEQAVEPEHDVAVGEVAQAEKAARLGDADKAVQYLRTVGAWTLDIATKIGVGVATAAIKSGAGW